MKKLLVICGPTATGKTALGLRLAKKFKGEIISADSRQVYKGMDISTGKDLPVNAKLKIKNEKLQVKIKNKQVIKPYRFDEIPVWLLDVVWPNQEFSVAQYYQLAWKVINYILKRKKLPILVGGTGFYIKAIIEDVPSKGIPPNWFLRKQLELKSVEALFEELAELDPFRAAQMNTSDRQNKRRLIRAIEVARWRVGNRLWQPQKLLKLDTLWIGLTAPLKKLYQAIDERINKQIKLGAEGEVKKLINQGYSWDFPSMSAMGYIEWQPLFEGKTARKEVMRRWKFDEHGYARRQMIWFRKQKQIHWFDIAQKGWENKVEKDVAIWYTQRNAKKS